MSGVWYMSDIWCLMYVLRQMYDVGLKMWRLMFVIRRLMSGMPPKHMSDDRCYDTSDVRYLMWEVRRLMYNVRCLVSDVWCLTWDIILISDIRCLTSEIIHLSHIRCLTSEIGRQMSDVWCLMSKICSKRLMYDVWYLMFFVRHLMSDVCLMSVVWCH